MPPEKPEPIIRYLRELGEPGFMARSPLDSTQGRSCS
jgi:hypothetical protein